MTNSTPSIIFWGTSVFAVPALGALLKEDYAICAVVTNPDERAGRKQLLTPSPVKIAAKENKIPVFQPTNLANDVCVRELPPADIYIVAAYGKIIPKNIVDIPKYGILNIHPSLLPRWRGPSPIQYTILSGDKETGVTLIRIDERMDHGPIIANYKTQIINHKTTYQDLHDELAKLGAKLLIETLPRWIAGEIIPRQQDDAKATYSKILKRDDGRIQWSRPADEIERVVRAFTPWPGTWSLWPTTSKFLRIKIEAADYSFEENPGGGIPGHVWQNKKGQVLVKCGKGSIALKNIIIEGKKSLTMSAVIRGYPNFVGTTLV